MRKLIKWSSMLTASALAVFGVTYSVFNYNPTLTQAEAVELLTQQEAYVGTNPVGLTFKQIDDALYTLTGVVRDGDCKKIVPQMPQQFAVILESGGGNLAEGMCLASHFKLRDVITIVRDTPVINEKGEEVYTPAQIEGAEGRVVCASSCSLLFLGGDRRYLIGNVWLGIHGPRTPDEVIYKVSPQALEAQAYQISAALLDLLKRLGIEDEEVRAAFVKIPSSSMYWLNPRDFEVKPELAALATHYRKFWGFTATQVQGEH